MHCGSARHRSIEEANDFGPLPDLDVDHERRDVAEHEVEPDPGAPAGAGLGPRPAALAARAADEVDHVALAQRTERVAHRDRDHVVVGAPPEHRAPIG